MYMCYDYFIINNYDNSVTVIYYLSKSPIKVAVQFFS